MLSEQQIGKNIERVNKLIETLSSEVKIPIQAMMDVVGEKYHSAPGSSSINRHDCYPGGFCDHTLRVFRNFKQLCELWYPEAQLNSIILVSLMHDLGKVCTLSGQDFYVPVKEDWKIKRGILYEHNKEIRDGLTHAQRSVRMLSHFGVPLTDDEYLAILSHDGLYVDENISFKNKQSKLAFLLHFADYYTVFGVKT